MRLGEVGAKKELEMEAFAELVSQTRQRTGQKEELKNLRKLPGRSTAPSKITLIAIVYGAICPPDFGSKPNV